MKQIVVGRYRKDLEVSIVFKIFFSPFICQKLYANEGIRVNKGKKPQEVTNVISTVYFHIRQQENSVENHKISFNSYRNH